MRVRFSKTMWLLVLDALIGGVSLPLAYWLRLGQPVLVWPSTSFFPTDVTNSFEPYLWPALVAPVATVGAAYLCGLYRNERPEPQFTDVMAVLKAATLAALILITFCSLYRGGFRYRGFEYSRAIYLVDWAWLLAAMTGVRLATRAMRLWPKAPETALRGG